MTTLETLERKIDRLLNMQAPPKKTWVGVIVIQKVTGWDKAFLRVARENGLVKYKNEDGKFLYLLESIPENFLIKK